MVPPHGHISGPAAHGRRAGVIVRITSYNVCYTKLLRAGGDTWQVSDLGIRKIAVRPGGNLLAVYESDGFSIHRVSLWNWTEKRRIFAKRFKDSVLSLAWSAKGTWLLVGNSSIEGITALDPETGNPVPLFKSPPGIRITSYNVCYTKLLRAEICFLEQPFVKDDKVSVAKKMEEVAKASGGKLTLSKMVLFQLGVN